MEFDLTGQPEIVQLAAGYALQIWEIAKSWALSPAAWSQFALLVLAYVLAVIAAARLRGTLTRLLTPAAEAESIIARSRRTVLMFLPLLLPLLAYVFTAVGESVVRSIFDSGAVIAFGKRVFLFLAVRTLVRDIISDPLLKLLGKYVLIPIAAIYALGLLDAVSAKLTETTISLGNISFSVMSLIRGLIAGSVLFWLGGWSNRQSAQFIESQQDMRPSLRQLIAKVVEFSIFGIAFLLLMNIMGINLSTLAFIGGAVGVGLGFGLQKIASNFISGVILLIEGQATVGDYVELDGGESGRIVKMTARAAILETFDGRWIVVPNEDFITTRVVNYSDSGSANRYEAPFSVSYDTDINRVPALIEAAVATHPGVLNEPYPPDCELRGFGDSGIDFAVEFWVNGFDDGPNKFTSDVLFLIWNTLKENDIEIPYPQRVVEIKGGVPDLAS
ncbi:mechanosensitive ion channel protein MscS [Roseobacter denitrificans]|uniref:Mechanosensitive ion channel family protein, putative n=1 Tax=Roseobacter denitrificans (strain ATCC 33942 / OCh 114) TaxID=375451 RepID=Q16E01_ROSDO|nr:mechanosensitive ion channel domain-containing protein [Roseobacter denitrificans]ABG29792.1 mechanosensitive ion channel family protein, putative [Roseobacter denitrificans OCh 114]AVL53020.1 mechanosensitive ion channel protein MscS [Roseobacter denitrificans]SFG27002.1 Mechanosensitive ion channel [Roseobacter denitrificans OCh 114]